MFMKLRTLYASGHNVYTKYLLLASAQCNLMNHRCELLLTYVKLGKHCSPVLLYISKISILIL